MSAAWLAEWYRLNRRVEGLAESAAIMQSSLGVSSADHSSIVAQIIGPSIRDLLACLNQFCKTYNSSLPEGVLGALDRLATRASLNLTGGDAAALSNLRVAAAILATASEVNFYLGDPELRGTRLVERAVIHLNRSLVVDAELRERWLRALESGETACEKLGAVHLLGHGIWGFKVSAAGAATDLVLSEKPLTSSGIDVSVAEYLVLTEWKVAEGQADAAPLSEGARTQASRYAGGILGGIELRSVRFIVLVSRETIQVPADFKCPDGTTFRHLNVAVEAETPSTAGKRLAARAAARFAKRSRNPAAE